MKATKKRVAQSAKPAPTKGRIPYRLIAIIVAAVLFVGGVIGTLCYFLFRAPTVFAYENVRVDTNTYSYWVGCYKSSSVRYDADTGFLDTNAGWNTAYGDGTYLSYYTDEIDRQIKQRIVAAALFDKSGYKLTEEETDEILKWVSEVYGEDEKAVKELLKKDYGADEKDVRAVALYEYKYIAYYYKVFGYDLSGAFDESLKEDAERFYNDNYVRFKQIFISDDQANNAARHIVREALPTVDENQFDLFIENYDSEGNMTTVYGDGAYLFSGASYTIYDTDGEDEEADAAKNAEILSAIRTLEIGKAIEVTTDGGSYFFYRCPLEENAYANPTNYWFGGDKSFPSFASTFSSYIYQDLLDAKIGDVEVNSEEKQNYTLINTKRNWEHNIVSMIR